MGVSFPMGARRAAPYAATALAVVLVLFGSFLALNDDGREERGFEATLVGEAEFSNILLDIKKADIESYGVEPGDKLILQFPDDRFVGYYTKTHSGIALFDIFISSYEDKDDVEIGIFCGDIQEMLGEYGYGTTFTIIPTGEKSEYYNKIPHYIAGYSDDPEDFDSIQTYANYREVTQGNFKEDRLYRSASPFQHNGMRYIYCDQYLREVGVDHIFSISLDMDRIAPYRYDGSYAFELYDEGRVTAKYLSTAIPFHEDEVLFVMNTIADLDGSIGFSCSHGKDRTGIYCAMLEALAGASYQEIREDYMLSMCNYYGIFPHSEEYYAVASMVLDRMFYLFANPSLIEDVTAIDWDEIDIGKYDAEEIVSGYLLYIGMTQERLDQLVASITG